MGVGALVLLASMLLMPWYGITLPAGPSRASATVFVNSSVDGWHGLSHLRWLILVTILLGLTLVCLQMARRAPALPVTASALVTLFGVLTVLALIYRVLINTPGPRKLGGIVGLVAALAILIGGYLSMREEGVAPGDEIKDIPTVTPEESAT